jgi:hypothetical protein
MNDPAKHVVFQKCKFHQTAVDCQKQEASHPELGERVLAIELQLVSKVQPDSLKLKIVHRVPKTFFLQKLMNPNSTWPRNHDVKYKIDFQMVNLILGIINGIKLRYQM